MVKPHPTNNAKISWAWWHTPVVPATQEAEAGESFGSRGGACSEPRFTALQPGQQRETLSQTTKQEKDKQIKKTNHTRERERERCDLSFI